MSPQNKNKTEYASKENTSKEALLEEDAVLSESNDDEDVFMGGQEPAPSPRAAHPPPAPTPRAAQPPPAPTQGDQPPAGQRRTVGRNAENEKTNPYAHISPFIIMKMVIPGVFGVAESDSEVKIIIKLKLSPVGGGKC